MANYLQLVRDLVSELGIGGLNNAGDSVPTSVSGQVGQLRNAVRWIRDAENNINVMWTDWLYLATDYSETLTVASTAVPAHSGSEVVRKWDRASFYLDITASTAAQLEWMEWHNFRRQVYRGSAARASSKPTAITEKRDGTMLLDNPSDSAYTLTAEFFRKPVLLSLDGDIPAMPEEFHRLIICEAAIKYGNKEAAGEIIQGFEAEHIYLLDKLEGSQLEGREFERRSTQDIDLVMEIPGGPDDDLRSF